MEVPRKLSVEAEAVFNEGIGLVLSRWSALQLAVDNEWGGRDSRRKAEQITADVFSWFTQSAEFLYIDDLEEILNEAMLSLNTMTEDGSIEEVAEKLIIMHEECVDGNYKSIETLREANQRRVSVPHVKQVNEEDDDDEDDDENNERDPTRENDSSSDMMVDTPQPPSNPNPNPNPVNMSEDGWEVVARKRNRGKRN